MSGGMNSTEELVDGRSGRGLGGIDAVQDGKTGVGAHDIVRDVPVPCPDAVARRQCELKVFVRAFPFADHQNCALCLLGEAQHPGWLAVVVKSWRVGERLITLFRNAFG